MNRLLISVAVCVAMPVLLPVASWAQAIELQNMNAATLRPYMMMSFGQFRTSGPFYNGAALAGGGAIGVFIKPRVSLELEFARPGLFATTVEQHAPVDISDQLRRELAPGEMEKLFALGRTEKHGRVAYSAAGLVGFHPKPWGPVRLGLRAGFGLQHLEWSQTQYVVVVRDLQSYTLREESGGSNNRIGLKLVLGIESAIAVTRHLSIVPELRIHLPLGFKDSAVRPAIGVRWMF